MTLTRFGRVLARWWLFIAGVVTAALVASILWQVFGPVPWRAEAELLLVLNLPPDSEDRQFSIEASRAQASAVIIEDLVRLTLGRELLREAHTAVVDQGEAMSFEALADTIDVFPLARGLRIELDWPDRVAGQALVDALVALLLVEQTRFYPALPEVGTLRQIDKTDEAMRPPAVIVALDVIVKTVVAVFLAVIVALLVDWRANRLYAEDIYELLEMPIIGSVQ